MTKFRKKPVVIDAEQFIYTARVWPEGVYQIDQEVWLDTLNGPVKIDSGEWIITGVKGEKYPCKPDIFKKTYEAV